MECLSDIDRGVSWSETWPHETRIQTQRNQCMLSILQVYATSVCSKCMLSILQMYAQYTTSVSSVYYKCMLSILQVYAQYNYYTEIIKCTRVFYVHKLYSAIWSEKTPIANEFLSYICTSRFTWKWKIPADLLCIIENRSLAKLLTRHPLTQEIFNLLPLFLSLSHPSPGSPAADVSSVHPHLPPLPLPWRPEPVHLPRSRRRSLPHPPPKPRESELFAEQLTIGDPERSPSYACCALQIAYFSIYL